MSNKKLNRKEKLFSFYATGFVGGRHVTLNEISDTIGRDRLEYFLENNDAKKEDPMYL